MKTPRDFAALLCFTLYPQTKSKNLNKYYVYATAFVFPQKYAWLNINSTISIQLNVGSWAASVFHLVT